MDCLDAWQEYTELLLGTGEGGDTLRRALARLCLDCAAVLGALYRFEPGEGRLQPVAAFGLDSDGLTGLSLGEGLAGEAAACRRPLTVSGLPADATWVAKLSFLSAVPRELCARPLLHGTRLLGVLVTASIDPRSPQQQQHEAAMAASLSLLLAADRSDIDMAQLPIVNPATGVYLEAYFIERLQVEFSRAFRYEFDLSLLLLSVMAAGREPVSESLRPTLFAALHDGLTTSLRDSDLWGHYGADRLMLALPHTSRQQARTVAEKVQHAASAGLPDLLPEAELIVGGATYPESNALSLGELIGKAEDAYQRASESWAEHTMVV